MSSHLFSKTVELLLAGEVICRFTRELEHTFLSDEDNSRKVNDYLWRIQRKVRSTQDETGFVLAHFDTETPRSKQETKWMFEQMSVHIRPVVHWLTLARRCDPMGRPLKAGEMLRESELLSAIEDSHDIVRELDDLCRIKPFINDNKSSKGQLSRVLGKLVDMGYLVPQGPNKIQYRATAKISLFYDILAFIKEHESIPDDEDDLEFSQMTLNS